MTRQIHLLFNMISNWTGTADTSYKISATLKIAELLNQLVDNMLLQGVYARLDRRTQTQLENG